MILERTLTNGDTIKTALLDAERLKKRVTFYTRTRTMIDKFTCRDTENKPITLGRFTISGGLIYYKRGEYDWQNISLDDVLKIDISDPETVKEATPAPEETPKKEQTPKTKRGSFYTLTNAGTIKKDGYIYNSGRNKYGIDNRGTTSRPRWTATDILSGLQIGSERPTKAAAIETALYFENKVIEQHNDPNNATIKKALAAIADAYKNNPIDNDAPRRPVKYGYIVYKYTSTSGTARAAIAPAKNPDCYYMDIPAASLPEYMQQISQETPKAYFIDKNTGLDIIPEGTPASTPAAKTEPKRNRLPRKFYKLYITMLTDTTAGQAGTRANVYRNQYGELVEETESGQIYAANLALLRSADLVRIDKIETEEPTPDTTPADVIPETTPAPDVSQESNTESAPETSPRLDVAGSQDRVSASTRLDVARLDVAGSNHATRPEESRTTLPPGPEKGPETVTESTTASQEERPLTPQAKPRRGPTSHAKTTSYTDTHGRRKTRYKAKYKASRSHAGPPQNPRFFKSTYFLDLVFKNPAKTKPIRFIGPVFEQVLGQLYTEGPPPGYQKMMQIPA